MQVYRLAFSPDGNLLVAAGGGGHMYVFGMINGKWEQVSHNKHHSDTVRYLFYYFHC